MPKITLFMAVLTLTGFQTIAANLATNTAADNVARPFVPLEVDGGKAAYKSAEAWLEFNAEGGAP